MIRSLDEMECKLILGRNFIGQLAYVYYNQPFIAPITYFYDSKADKIIGYAGEGHKISALRKHNRVAFLVGEIDSVHKWKSVLVQGIYEELSGSYARSQLHSFSLGVKDLVFKKDHEDLDFINEFSCNIHEDETPIIYDIKIETITGRMRDH